MYTESIGANNVPAFLSKLWRLVDSSQNNDLISWSQNGKSFIIRNQAKFAKELLPLYFKHNNMASFIRQLNMYGFRKITHIENTGLKVENDEIEFYHSCFVKGQENMLEYIKRKNSLSVAHAKSNGALEDKTNKEEVHLILTDVKGIKNKQENMNSMLVNLQNENETLWKEIASLRHKHQKQQAIVERLIHFLMSLVQTGNIGLKRKAPLMIDSDKDGNKNINLSTIASNILNPDSGPVIQEITHGLLDDEYDNNVNQSDGNKNINLSTIASNILNPDSGPVIQEITHGLLDDEYDNDVNSPVINTAVSDTSEPAAQFDDANDSPQSNIVNDQIQIINSTTQPAQQTPTTSNVCPNITAATFDDHIGGIDNELNSLQDQLVYGNFDIDANMVMGLFSNDSPKCIEGTSSNKINSPLSTPKPIIQEEPNNLNSNFDLCDNYPIVSDNLFDSQTGFLQSGLNDVNNSMIKQHDLNESIFNTDDLLTTDDDINQLLILNNQSNQDDLYHKEKRKRIS